MSKERDIAASISADIGGQAYRELQVLSIRQDCSIQDIAGELLDSLFENWEDKSSIKVADVQLLQQQVKSLETQMEKLSAQLEAIAKLPILNPSEPSAATATDESAETIDELVENVVDAADSEPAVQEALGENEVQENASAW